MGWTKLGKVTLKNNESANADNRQPHFKGSIPMAVTIKKSDELNISLWLNYDKNDPNKIVSGSIHLSNFTKEDELFPNG